MWKFFIAFDKFRYALSFGRCQTTVGERGKSPSFISTCSGWRTLAAGALIFLAGCTQPPENPLRVASLPWPGYTTLHLAQSLGYFDPSRIRILNLTNASQGSNALRNGTVDAALLTIDEVLLLLQDNVDLRVVLVLDVSNGADVVMARPNITTLSNLRGKRIGVETSAIGATMFDAMLSAANMAPADVKLVSMPVNEHAAAYISNKVDAVVTFEPVRSLLINQGAHILFDSSKIPDRIFDVLAVRTEALANYRLEISSLVAAQFKALDYLARQPQDSAVRIAPYLGVRADQVLSQFAGIKLPGLGENRALLSGQKPQLATLTGEMNAKLLQHHLIKKMVNTDTLFTPEFLAPPGQ